MFFFWTPVKGRKWEAVILYEDVKTKESQRIEAILFMADPKKYTFPKQL